MKNKKNNKKHLLYTKITSKNGDVEYDILLSSDLEKSHHHVNFIGTLNKDEIIYHIPSFDDQLPETPITNCKTLQECPNRGNYCDTLLPCDHKEVCIQQLPQNKQKKFKKLHNRALKKLGRCDDIIACNNTLYFFELKSSHTLPDCKAFEQLKSSKERILQHQVNYDFNFTVDENTSCKLILCLPEKNLKTFIDQSRVTNPSNSLTISPLIQKEKLPLCWHDILITSKNIINLIDIDNDLLIQTNMLATNN